MDPYCLKKTEVTELNTCLNEERTMGRTTQGAFVGYVDAYPMQNI